MPASADAALFAELAATLTKYGAIDRFGIALLRSPFPMAEGEVLLESTDIASRTQTLRPVHGRPANAVETAWRLGPDGQAMVGCMCSEDSTGNHTGEHVVSRG